MAVTVSGYNQVTKAIANKEITYTSLKAMLLSSSASFTATHTLISQVANGSTAAFTVSIASPGVVTWTAHGLSNGNRVLVTTTGALPTGLTAGTWYYVVNKTTNTFELSATSGGASINTSGSQSGTHTAFALTSSGYEVQGNGWTAGGQSVANFAWTTVTTNDALGDGDDIVVTASGGAIGPASAAVIYDSLTGKVLEYIDFGGAETAGDTTDFKLRIPNGLLALNLT